MPYLLFTGNHRPIM